MPVLLQRFAEFFTQPGTNIVEWRHQRENVKAYMICKMKDLGDACDHERCTANASSSVLHGQEQSGLKLVRGRSQLN